MKLPGIEKEFIIIGENVHTSRILRRQGKLVTENPDGVESVRFLDVNKNRHYMVIPEEIKKAQAFEEGRVHHIKIAIGAAMSGQEPEASVGMEYLRRTVQRQVDAGADFLDLNVDEISWRLEEQKEAMKWLVPTVKQMCSLPLSVDSSNTEIMQVGLEAYDGGNGRALMNSASLERISALDVAVEHNTKVIVSASSEDGMPQNAEERITNASRMVDAALEKGIARGDIFVDPLVFPIGVETEAGNYFFETIRQLREKYGPEIHISGGFSNVSFQMPLRHLINDVFLILALEAGADSGIIDPVASKPQDAVSIDRESKAYTLTRDMLLGQDRLCKTFLRAYRKGELEISD